MKRDRHADTASASPQSFRRRRSPSVVEGAAASDRRRIERWYHVEGVASEMRHFLDTICGCPTSAAQLAEDDVESGRRLVAADVLREVADVLFNALTYHGNPGDSYEAVRRLLHPSVRILQLFAGCVLSPSGEYLTFNGQESLPQAAAVWCAADTLLRSSADPPLARHHHVTATTFAFCECAGFGWFQGLDSVPVVVREMCRGALSADVLVLADAMLSDAGCTTIARRTGTQCASAHHRYGVGIAIFARRALIPCSALSLETVVAHAVLLSCCGPLVLHVHFPASDLRTHSSTAAAAESQLQRDAAVWKDWLNRVSQAPLPAVLLVSGDRCDFSAPPNFRCAQHSTLPSLGCWVRGGECSAWSDSFTLLAPPSTQTPLSDCEEPVRRSGISCSPFAVAWCGV